MFITALLSAALSLPLLAAAAPAACANPPNGGLDYQVTKYAGHSPSQIPINTEHTNWQIVTFTDPNTCETFECRYEWQDGATDTPDNGFVPCTANITNVEFWEPSYQVVQIRHTYNSVNEQGDTLTWTATANGTVPYVTNCGGSGTCNWGLPAGSNIAVPVVEIHVVA